MMIARILALTYICFLLKSQTNMGKITLAYVPFAKPFISVADVSITDLWWNMLIMPLKAGCPLSWKLLLRTRNCQLQFAFLNVTQTQSRGKEGSLMPRANEQWLQLKLPLRGSLQWFCIFTVLTVINCGGYSGFAIVEEELNESRSEKRTCIN